MHLIRLKKVLYIYNAVKLIAYFSGTFAVCSVIDTMVANKEEPNLILDTTISGRSSEVIKSLSKSLGIPSLSMAYGDLLDSR